MSAFILDALEREIARLNTYRFDYYDHLRPMFAQLEAAGVGLCPTGVVRKSA